MLANMFGKKGYKPKLEDFLIGAIADGEDVFQSEDEIRGKLHEMMAQQQRAKKGEKV